MNNEFSVYWWDCDNEQNLELKFVTPKRAVDAAYRLTHGPANILGIVSRVIITDGGDSTVFEWTKDKGITWPKNQNA